MVAGGMISVVVRRMTRVSGNRLVFGDFIDMACKRPYRAVANRADDEPDHEKTPEHDASIHNMPVPARTSSIIPAPAILAAAAREPGGIPQTRFLPFDCPPVSTATDGVVPTCSPVCPQAGERCGHDNRAT